MSVRFQFAGDKDISAGRAGGFSIFKPVVIGGGCPDAGTPTGSIVRDTYTDGTTVYVSEMNNYYYNQNADFTVFNDGSCGTYVDYSTAANVGFKSGGTVIVYGNWYEYATGSTVTVIGNDYPSEEARDIFFHDGVGSYSVQYAAFVRYKAANTLITNEPEVFPVPETGGSNYGTGRYTSYYHSGDGGYTTSTTGDYYASGTLIWQNVVNTYYLSLPSGGTPESSYNGTRYEWNGFGVYVEYTNWYVPYGTFIENYDGYSYYHDGNGSYYTVPY